MGGFDELDKVRAAFRPGARVVRRDVPGALAPLPDLGDLSGAPSRPPSRPPEAPSLADRLRLHLGDLEPSAARPGPPEAPERAPDLSELSDAGGWVVVDRGEWEDGPTRRPWAKGAREASRRGVRFGTVPVADLPDDVPVSGAVMSYEEALEFARELEGTREVMES